MTYNVLVGTLNPTHSLMLDVCLVVIAVLAVTATSAGVGGELADVLEEVHQLRMQLERCVSSNDKLRRTLRKYGTGAAAPSSADDVCLTGDGE